MIRIRSRYRHSFSVDNNLIIQIKLQTRIVFAFIGIFLCVVILYSRFTITPIVILLLLICLYQSGRNTTIVFSKLEGRLRIFHKFWGVILRKKELSIQSITGVKIRSVVYNTQILRRENPNINYLYIEVNSDDHPIITIDDSTHLSELENLAEVMSEYITIPYQILKLDN